MSADTKTTEAPPPSTLARAPAVVLGRLPGLDAYTANKVLAALQAAIKPQAPLEAIERGLIKWLADRPAGAAKAVQGLLTKHCLGPTRATGAAQEVADSLILLAETHRRHKRQPAVLRLVQKPAGAA